MSSIRNISSSNNMPIDLAKKLGKNGIVEIISVMWQGYYDLYSEAIITTDMRENKITQEWFFRVSKRWYSENRAARISIDLRPITQYEDDTLAKKQGQSPTIDFCFRAWEENEGYFGAECKNLYGTNVKYIQRYINTGINNYVSGRYGSKSSVSSVIGHVLSGNVSEVVTKLNDELLKLKMNTHLNKILGIREEEYRSFHTRTLDGAQIVIHHLFFNFAV